MTAHAWPNLARLEPALPGWRAERSPADGGALAGLEQWLRGLPRHLPGRRKAMRRFVRRVRAHEQTLEHVDEPALAAAVAASRRALSTRGLDDHTVAVSFALIGELAARQLGLRPYGSQVGAAWLLLGGHVAEMATGEGKTLSASLAAGTAALAGLPTHVMSVNDYLTARDAEGLAPLYRALGLDVGVVVHGLDDEQRRAAYAADVVYGTSREIVFDYLRDRIVLGRRSRALEYRVEPLFGEAGCHGRLLQRGLHFAIVDEADSVLVDEARTPLVISGSGASGHEKRFLSQALALAGRLERDEHYVLDEARRAVRLLAAGQERARVLSAGLGALWTGRVRREEALTQALAALELYHRDRDYLVRDETIEIIDPLTGRVTPGRAWERGLHQLIELKEDCPMSRQRQTRARMSYQSFFARYQHLAGMTGTAAELRAELWRVYGLDVVRVPLNRPPRRHTHRAQVFDDEARKWAAVAARSRTLVDAGRAVLVGTSSVRASERAAAVCRAAGLDPAVLNARQDAEEAAIVARAGEPGQVTIATSMAGRGTDIRLDPAVAAAGGLHVILTEHFESARVDRQLAGRCARQGDPGSFEVMVSLGDVDYAAPTARLLARLAAAAGPRRAPWRWLGLLALRLDQRARERQSRRDREATRRFDRHSRDLLAISGRAD